MPWMAQKEAELRYLLRNFGSAPGVDEAPFSVEDFEAILLSNDPYSDYLDADEYADFERDTFQRYVGIGVEIQRLGQRITVLRVFSGGSAEEGGLLPNDQILAVDGRSVETATVGEAVELIRGLPGTQLALRVYRPEERRERELTLQRREVAYDSVRDVEMLDDGVGYLRITQFGARTGQEFKLALDKLEARGMDRGLIIDLRNNPGGMLNAAVEISEVFLEEDDLIVSLKGTGQRRSKDHEYRASTPLRDRDYRVAVLINRSSASASEIVAGALQDHGVAYVIGERSHGKGSVQSVFSLRDGSGLRMTTAHYFLPLGETIEQLGVTPDLPISLPMEDRYRLFLQLRHRASLGDEAFEEQFDFEPIEDEVLQAALKHLDE